MASTEATAAELRRAVLLRATELDEVVHNLCGPLGHSHGDLRAALELAGKFPAELRLVVNREWHRNATPGPRALILTTLLRHVNFVADFVEEHLAHGTRRELSEALVDEIRSELDALDLAHYKVVTSHGKANNFVTTYGDLSKAIFRPLASPNALALGPAPYALFKMPRIEGAGVQWRPILLGHEVAHVAVSERDAVSTFDLGAKFDVRRAGGLANPNAHPGLPPAAIARGLYQIAEAWTTELLCDAHALYRFGPAAVAALGEYFVVIGSGDLLSRSHPPGILRMRLLLDQLGLVHDPRLLNVVTPWADHTPTAINFAEPWAQYLATMFQAGAVDLVQAVSTFPTTEYRSTDRVDAIHQIADRIKAGIPGQEIISTVTDICAAVDQDVVNAVWVARAEDADTPIDTLGKKAIESLDFLRRWTSAGGSLPLDLHMPIIAPAVPLPTEAGVASLNDDQIVQRIRVDDDRRLIVTPLLNRPKGTAIDLRLGNRFIVFRRTGTTSFDPLGADDDPRAMQMYVELSWNEQFVLHPQEVVLGATLEYLVMPADLTGQVITRSSYGRLGLLSATAVQIHPRFHGCLTLELVNLSTIPIKLTPGERIAQLMLWRTKAVKPSPEKYAYSIGPQFSRVRDDPEADVLRTLRHP